MSDEPVRESEQGAGWVWVFNGARGTFPGGVFTTRERAEAWIAERRLSGTLTAYPLDVPAYDWAIGRGDFRPKSEKHATPRFIGSFSSGAQEHYHYANGVEGTSTGDDVEGG